MRLFYVVQPSVSVAKAQRLVLAFNLATIIIEHFDKATAAFPTALKTRVHFLYMLSQRVKIV
jgi:hypothetical protein